MRHGGVAYRSLPAGRQVVRSLVPDLFERSEASTITNRNPAYGGRLAEWFKARAWKARGRKPSQVRILYLPPCAEERRHWN